MENKHLLVLISGKQGSGKTTLANVLSGLLEKTGKIAVHRYKYADVLYEIHDEVMDIMSNYLPFGHPMFNGPDKRLLQLLGTDWARATYGADIWVEILKNRLKEKSLSRYYQRHYLAIVDDARFPNEINIEWPDKLKVRLEADREDRKARTDCWRDNESHASETALDDATVNGEFDMYLDTSNGQLSALEAARAVKWQILSMLGIDLRPETEVKI